MGQAGRNRVFRPQGLVEQVPAEQALVQSSVAIVK